MARVFWMLAVIGLLVLSLTFVVVPETLAREDRVEHTLRADLHIYRRSCAIAGFCRTCSRRHVQWRPVQLHLRLLIRGPEGLRPLGNHLQLPVRSRNYRDDGLGQINARLVRTRSLERLTRTAMSVSAVGCWG